MPSRTSDVNVELDAQDLTRLLRESRAFDKKFATAVRKRLRDAAKPAIADVKRTLTSAPVKTDTGLRRGLAAGTKLSIRTGRLAGISIATTGAKLPAEKRAMVRAYNKPSFRHPVFGNRDVWAAQPGRPYFGVVLDHHKQGMRQGIVQALDDAAATITAGRVR